MLTEVAQYKWTYLLTYLLAFSYLFNALNLQGNSQRMLMGLDYGSDAQ